MEFTLIPQFILIFSLVGILFILGRNFSKFKEISKPISESPLTPFDKEEYSQERNAMKEVAARIKEEEEKFKYLCQRLAKRINWRTAQEKYKQFSSFAHAKLEKVLKKARINFLKLDRKTAALIEKARKKKEKHAADILETKKPEIFPEEKLESVDEKDKETENDTPPVEISEAENKKEIKGVKKSKEKEYVEMIGEDPKNVDAYWKLGIIYSRKRNYRDALACFKQIIKIKPNYEKAKKKIKDISEKIRKK